MRQIDILCLLIDGNGMRAFTKQVIPKLVKLASFREYLASRGIDPDPYYPALPLSEGDAGLRAFVNSPCQLDRDRTVRHRSA